MPPDHVSNDLINEIFERLPPKSLVRFRSLSKSWCSHIHTTDFISRYALRSKKKTPKILIRHKFFDVKEDKRMTVLVNGEPQLWKRRDDMYTIHSEDQFVSSNPEWLDVSIPALKFPMAMGDTYIGDIVGSSNGILCLYYYSNKTICLWNPSIRRVISLPPAPDQSGLGAILVGIGFDQAIDDYKIVWISQKISFVYTLKKGAWCPIIASPSNEVRYQESCACFFNGSLHWVVVGNYKNGDCRYILKFDLATHAFGSISLPKPWETRQLTIIDGHLAVVPLQCWTRPPDGEDNKIWILKDSNKCWHAVYDFGQFKPKWTHLSRGANSLLHLTTNGHMLLYIGYGLPNFSKGDTYGVYNPETRTWDPSMIMRFQDSLHLDMQTYAETLELLNTEPNCSGPNGKSKFDDIVR